MSRCMVVFCNYLDRAQQEHPLPWREERHPEHGRVLVATDGAIVVLCQEDTLVEAIIAYVNGETSLFGPRQSVA